MTRVVALAAVTEAEGSKLLQRAQIDAQQASVSELEVMLDDAREDLADCVLRAPFPGRVTVVHVSEGSFVQPGSPVVTLTMMNPVKVELTTSASESERLVKGSDATVYPTIGTEVNMERSIQATLYEKGGVADEATRTFSIGLIAPNERRVAPDYESELARVQYLLPILENPIHQPGAGLFTIADGIFEDETRHVSIQGQGSRAGLSKRECTHATPRCREGPRLARRAGRSNRELHDRGDPRVG